MKTLTMLVAVVLAACGPEPEPCPVCADTTEMETALQLARAANAQQTEDLATLTATLLEQDTEIGRLTDALAEAESAASVPVAAGPEGYVLGCVQYDDPAPSYGCEWVRPGLIPSGLPRAAR